MCTLCVARSLEAWSSSCVISRNYGNKVEVITGENGARIGVHETVQLMCAPGIARHTLELQEHSTCINLKRKQKKLLCGRLFKTRSFICKTLIEL